MATGRGEAAGFTRLDWVRDAFVRALGIDPFPGTLNLVIEDPDDRAGWLAIRTRPGRILEPPSSAWCPAHCYAVRLNGSLPAGIVVPEVAGYPAWQVELVAALPIRETLALGDGDRVVVEASDPLPVRAVVFDVDGTLVDSLPAFRVVAERAARPYGIVITDAIVREALNTDRAFWDLALPSDYADRAAVMATLSREAARCWPDVLREHGRVVAGVADALRALRASGMKLGIVTGARRTSLAPLERDGLLDLADAVVTGEDVARRKPDPEGLTACAAALEVAPQDAVYVGDTPLDVRAARAAGMFAVAVLSGAGDSALLSACRPDHLVHSVARMTDVVARG